MARQQEAAGLVRRLGSASPAEQLEAARGLQELAAAPGGAQRIQRAGGVPALVRLLQGGGSEELQIAAATALARMAMQGRDMNSHIYAAGAGRAVAESLSRSRSPELAFLLLGLLSNLSTCEEQQVADELAASPGCLARLAQLATDSSQEPMVQYTTLALLAGPLLATNRSAVAAAAAPHAAAIVQRLLPRPAAGIPEAWREQMYAAGLLAVLAGESAELTARMVAAGAVPRLVGLLSASSPQQLPLQRSAVSCLQRLVIKHPSAAGQLAAIDGAAEVLVQLLGSHPPPASCKQAWDKAEVGTSLDAAALLWQLIHADHAAVAGRAVAAGAVPQLTRVLRWGAPRLEWLGRQRQWEEEAETTEMLCVNACITLLLILWRNSRPSTGTSAAHAALPPLVQQVLQHSRSRVALFGASKLLALLRDPSIQSTSALQQGAAEVLRQLQPGGHPDRAAAIAALLSELTGGAQRQAGAARAAAGPSSSSSSGAAQQAGEHKGAAPAACAACSALPPAGRKFQVCAGCRAVRYCSPACQKAAWRSGHKVACRAAQGGAQGGAGSGGG
jgi:hypothetical protein